MIQILDRELKEDVGRRKVIYCYGKKVDESGFGEKESVGSRLGVRVGQLSWKFYISSGR